MKPGDHHSGEDRSHHPGGDRLEKYRLDLEKELEAILDYWMRHTPDDEQGGFYGQIDDKNIADPQAPKGVVLNSRILWTFSAAYAHNKDPQYLSFAQRAYEYLDAHFIDREYGGVFWSVDHAGALLDGRKQIYGLAFCMYGLSEYYLISRDQAALDRAIALFRVIEQYSYDPLRPGYYEAFARDWGPLEDLRLSAKDANEKKTMNTHLHVIEAYANLFRAWPDPFLRQQITGLLRIFERHIIDGSTGHLHLFFDENWKNRPGIVSYGHDIEAAWLLQESAGIIWDPEWMMKSGKWAIRMAYAAAEGLDKDGGLWYEEEAGHLVREKHWWAQAEAMVGFFNAWQETGERDWLQKSLANWDFVRSHIKDPHYGEWVWGVQEDHSPMPGQDKAGFWKCPYHNGRACLELIRRISGDDH
jgi:mannobiose 2-epimerase